MITIKAGTKAANKKEAYALVQRLCANETLVEHELHSLLLHFAPPVKASKDTFSWVASFVAVKDIREGLNYVYSDGKRIIATNGHALAWSAIVLPEGYYCPKTGNMVEGVDYKYPDIDRVVPLEWTDIPAELRSIDAMLGQCELQAIEEPRDGCKQVRKIPVTFPVYLDERYAGKAIAGGNAQLTYVRSDGTSQDAVRGNTDLGSFVIMPRRMY